MFHFFKKILSQNKDLDFDELLQEHPISFLDTLDCSPIHPISQYDAFQIANQYLKDDFVHRDKRQITYLSFQRASIVLSQEETYWDVHITEGEISWVNRGTCYDGILYGKDFTKLHCHISTQDGTYFYLAK